MAWPYFYSEKELVSTDMHGDFEEDKYPEQKGKLLRLTSNSSGIY